MDGFTDIRDSRSGLLLSLSGYGFGVCPFLTVSPGETAEDLAVKIKTLTDLAEIKACPAGLDIPIDGMLLRFDSFSYSASLGRTGHHYNDGIAFNLRMTPMKRYSAPLSGRQGAAANCPGCSI